MNIFISVRDLINIYIFDSQQAHFLNNVPLLYSFVRDFSEDDQVEAETCRSHKCDKWLFVADCAIFGLTL